MAKIIKRWTDPIPPPEGEIETAPIGPTCPGCGRTLPPNYDTVRRCYWTFTGYDEEPDVYADWSDKHNCWIVRDRHHRIVRRKWLGHYGKDGESTFCTYYCAFRWATKEIRKRRAKS